MSYSPHPRSSPIPRHLLAALDNIRAALRWANQESPELTLELAGLLKLFWRVRGHLDEGRRWLESALAHEGFESTAGRARALEASGALAQRRGDYVVARDFSRPRSSTKRRSSCAVRPGAMSNS